MYFFYFMVSTIIIHKKGDLLYSISLLVPCLAVHVVRGNLPSIGHILTVMLLLLWLLLLLLWTVIERVPLAPLIELRLNKANRHKRKHFISNNT